MKRLLCLILLGSTASLVFADNIRFAAPELDEPVVRFAVVGDLTGGERAGVYEAAVAAIEQLKPDFILSVGDLIEGGTEDVSQMNREWNAFTSRMAAIDTPFYPLVGNHDISNMAMREWWESSVGPRYYHFRLGDVLFLMLDTEDFSAETFAEIKALRNEAVQVYKEQGKEAFFATEYSKLNERKYGTISEQQSAYFEKVLGENGDVSWVFVMMHKPMWDSASSGYTQLERALADFPYTTLSGHEHSFYHEERLGRDHIQLGTTGGEFTPKTRGEYMDHILWVTLREDGPVITNIRLDGLLDKTGKRLVEGAF